MSYEEIEVKFIIDDLPSIRQRILAIGACLKTPRTYEDNVTFDTPDQQLRRQGRLLRLRRDQRHIVTYKEPSLTKHEDFKVLREYEVSVNDFAQMYAILEKIGLRPTLRYEKYRETFTYKNGELLLDETPCGVFLEIEGSQETIRDLAAQLGIDFKTRLTAGYGEIFEAVCATYNLHLPGITFDNFRSLHINLHACNLT
jgi:adenylate cyclase class 2